MVGMGRYTGTLGVLWTAIHNCRHSRQAQKYFEVHPKSPCCHTPYPELCPSHLNIPSSPQSIPLARALNGWSAGFFPI